MLHVDQKGKLKYKALLHATRIYRLHQNQYSVNIFAQKAVILKTQSIQA